MTLTDLQDYANRRTKETFRGKVISPVTVKKEVATFRAVWNEGVRHRLITGAAPVRGLKYDKGAEALPFMTWVEIEGRIAKGGVTEEQAGRLWDCLFLDTGQVADVLDYVKANAAYSFVYPMFVFVAHTGARRSEMMRSRVEDLDFRADDVVIREKKRDRSVRVTFRRVPMSPLLRQVMQEWLGRHPGGPFTFCLADVVYRSRKRSRHTGYRSQKNRSTTLAGRMATVRERTERPGREPLTVNEASHYFDKTLAGSKWEVLRGFHVFRHSFASNLARAGVDQREIDGLMGHTTEAMRGAIATSSPSSARTPSGGSSVKGAGPSFWSRSSSSWGIRHSPWRPRPWTFLAPGTCPKLHHWRTVHSDRPSRWAASSVVYVSLTTDEPKNFSMRSSRSRSSRWPSTSRRTISTKSCSTMCISRVYGM